MLKQHYLFCFFYYGFLLPNLVYGSEQDWFEKPPIYGSHKYHFNFNNNAFHEINSSGVVSSEFDLLPNEIAKKVFDYCSIKDRYVLRQVTKNLSKRIIVFFDGRKDCDGTTYGLTLNLKVGIPTAQFAMKFVYHLLVPSYDYILSPQIIDPSTNQICSSMAEGRLQLGGHIPIIENDHEGFKILAQSLKYQRKIHLVFNEYPISAPRNTIITLLNALKDKSHVEDLTLSSLALDDSVVPILTQFLSENRTLQHLNLFPTMISDAGARTLSETLEKNSYLKTLNLDGSSITEWGENMLINAFHKKNSFIRIQEEVIEKYYRKRIYDPIHGRNLYLKN